MIKEIRYGMQMKMEPAKKLTDPSKIVGYRWYIYSCNKKPIARSANLYKTKGNAKKNALKFIKAIKEKQCEISS